MYPQIFSAAKQVDHAFLIILGFSVFILVVVTIAMLWFLWRYNYKRNPVAADIRGNIWAEILWTVLPTIIVLGLFWTGWTSFKAMRTIPEGAMVVQVEARMWSWKFTYENGKTSPVLVVPIDTPISLELSSRDVIHSFYIPAMRVKWDVVPGMDTKAWIESDTLGEYDIFCAEYCGLKHADMITKLKVMDEHEFDEWLNGEPEGNDDKPRGLALMEEFGCFDCHAMDGTSDMAPPLNNIAGKQQLIILPDGTKRTVVMDEKYIASSILTPGAELVDGFGDEMPSFADELNKEDVDAIAAYLLGKATGGKVEHPGQHMADEEGCLSCHTTDGTDDAGPTFKGLFGSTVKIRANGVEKTIVVDDAYLRRSIIAPSEQIVEGYDDTMPIYDDMNEETLGGIISFIKSLGTEQ